MERETRREREEAKKSAAPRDRNDEGEVGREIEKLGEKVDQRGKPKRGRGEAERARRSGQKLGAGGTRTRENDESANTHRPPGAAYPAGSPTRVLGQLTSSSSAAGVT